VICMQGIIKKLSYVLSALIIVAAILYSQKSEGAKIVGIEVASYTHTDAASYISSSSTIPHALCASGQIHEWSGSAWVCGEDDTGSGGSSNWGWYSALGISPSSTVGIVVQTTVTTTNLTVTSISGIVKCNNESLCQAAVSGTDYEAAITAGTTAQYWRGDKTFQTLNSAAVTESGNLYYTDARVASYINASTTMPHINYSSTQFWRGDGTWDVPVGSYGDANVNSLINASSTISLPRCASGEIVEWSGTRWDCGVDNSVAGPSTTSLAEFTICERCDAWTNLGVGITPGASSSTLSHIDLRAFTDYRVQYNFLVAASTGDLTFVCSNDTAFALTATTQLAIVLNPAAGNTTIGPWTTIPAGCKTSGGVYTRLQMANGNGTEDPSLRYFRLQVR